VGSDLVGTRAETAGKRTETAAAVVGSELVGTRAELVGTRTETAAAAAAVESELVGTRTETAAAVVAWKTTSSLTPNPITAESAELKLHIHSILDTCLQINY